MRYLSFFYMILFIIGCTHKQELPSVDTLNSKEDTISYSVGAEIGESLNRQQIDFEYEILITGLVDA